MRSIKREDSIEIKIKALSNFSSIITNIGLKDFVVNILQKEYSEINDDLIIDFSFFTRHFCSWYLKSEKSIQENFIMYVEDL